MVLSKYMLSGLTFEILNHGTTCSSCDVPIYCITASEPRGEGTPYNGLQQGAPPKRGTFFRLLVYERVGISLIEIYERGGKSVMILVCKKAQKG